VDTAISRQIARYAVGLTYADLPEDVVHHIKRYLYDSIGCALGSMHTKDVNIIKNICREMGGVEEARILGFGFRCPAVNAGFLNSLMIRSLDFNDIYWKQDPSHPSDLIPAALALGEKVGADMKDVMTAIVLGYEFEQRMCEFAKPGLRERKWHHATITQFVSPIVAGKILGLNEDQMVNAIGISASHHHTIGCPTAGKLTMMKNTVDPMAVQAGIMAALMAEKGYSGTEAIFEGKEGLMDVYGPDWDMEALLGGLGDDFRIRFCSMKAFPTEALTHTHISAVIKIMSENDLNYKEIESVTITTIARACDILFDSHKYRPDSRETADHSLPYCVACALVDHRVTTKSFDEEKMNDPAIWEVIDKIKGEASEEFEKLFPAKQPSKVVIRLMDGREYSLYLEYPKGDPREPMTEEDLDAKVGALCGERFNVDKLRKHIYHCESMSAVEFMNNLQ